MLTWPLSARYQWQLKHVHLQPLSSCLQLKHIHLQPLGNPSLHVDNNTASWRLTILPSNLQSLRCNHTVEMWWRILLPPGWHTLYHVRGSTTPSLELTNLQPNWTILLHNCMGLQGALELLA